ncbi:MAG: cation:proton antiporter [Verrucomicrobiales bacterium]|nr:cation:proton antiporter [Verrucomicrobiales bacterium]
MHAITFLQDLAVVMIVAALVTVVFHRLRQPVVLGYIIAGVIIGPHTPPFPLIHDEDTIKTLSELGVILLMFSLGLEFSLKKLQRVGGTAFIAAFLEILVMAWVGYEIGRLFGWNTMDSLFLGAMLSISSTTIIVKALAELGKSRDSFAQLIFGILIIEDILAIAMIALLSGIAMTGSLHVGDVVHTLGRLSIFLVASLVVGLLAVPRLLTYITRFRSNEMLLVTVLGLCFGFSLLAVKLGYSVALGAFIIGAVIAESREIHRVEHLIEPVRDMFSAIFFVAIGMLIEPRMLAEYWLPILVITVAVVVGKILSCSFGTFVGGNDLRSSLRVGMGLAQIGEFSFIIASLGLTLNVTSRFLYPIAVAVSALTTLLTPYLIRSADGMVTRFDRHAPESVVNALAVYTDWLGRLGRRPSNLATKLMRRWVLQMLLNTALMAAVFIAVAFVGQHPPEALKRWDPGGDWLKAVLWLVAVIASLPMFIATSRKLQALGLLVAETRVTEKAAGERTAAIRAIVAQVVPITGTAILGLVVIVLSSTLLPTIKVFLGMLVLAGLISWLLRRSFIRVYSKAQIALEETLAEHPPAEPEPVPAKPLPPLLREADLKTITLGALSPAAGRRIRDLQLRTRCGASIVGIERNLTSLVNPGSEEELRAGDHLLLLGSTEQIRSAEQFLNG